MKRTRRVRAWQPPPPCLKCASLPARDTVESTPPKGKRAAGAVILLPNASQTRQHSRRISRASAERVFLRRQSRRPKDAVRRVPRGCTRQQVLGRVPAPPVL